MDEGRGRRIRRAQLSAGAMTALLAVAGVVGYGIQGGLPWWAVAASAVVMAGLAGWAGSRIGRRNGIRDEFLAPGEEVLATYTVRPPYTEHVPSAPSEGPQYQLRVTTHGVQMWERAVLLWRHPWPELRVLADGPRLRIHRQGQEAGTMLFEQHGAVREICRTARRHGAG